MSFIPPLPTGYTPGHGPKKKKTSKPPTNKLESNKVHQFASIPGSPPTIYFFFLKNVTLAPFTTCIYYELLHGISIWSIPLAIPAFTISTRNVKDKNSWYYYQLLVAHYTRWQINFYKHHTFHNNNLLDRKYKSNTLNPSFLCTIPINTNFLILPHGSTSFISINVYMNPRMQRGFHIPFHKWALILPPGSTLFISIYVFMNPRIQRGFHIPIH